MQFTISILHLPSKMKLIHIADFAGTYFATQTSSYALTAYLVWLKHKVKFFQKRRIKILSSFTKFILVYVPTSNQACRWYFYAPQTS